MTTWLLLALIAALFWALANILDKITMTNYISSSSVYVTLDAVIGLVPIIFIASLSISTIFIGNTAILIGLFTGFAMTFFSFLYSKALSFSDVSIVAILTQTIPVYSLIIGLVFLKQDYSFGEYFGVTLIILVSVLASLDTTEIKLSRLFKVSAGWGVLVLMMPATVMMSISYGLQDYVISGSPALGVYFWGRVGSLISIIPFLVAPEPRQKIMLFFTSFSRGSNYKVLPILLIQEILNLGALYAILLAYQFGPLGLVATAASTQPFFVVLIMIILAQIRPKFLEHIASKPNKKRLLISLILIVGIYLIQQ